MRLIYTLLFYLLTPLVFLRLYWKGFKTPEHRKRWKERLAVYQQKFPTQVIWIHAVSVGEAEAVFPLVKRLQQQYPSNQFLVTTTTPTGSARVKDVLTDTVSHVYLPYDLPCVVDRFITTFKPKVAVIMEKEIWPNLFLACTKNNIPVLIINARLSENSAKGYKKIPWLIKPVFDAGVQICTQTEEDKQQFIEIGAKESTTSVTGNLKFDLILDESLIGRANEIKKQIFPDRFVWLIASTHDKEEQIFFDIYPQLKKQIPELLLMVVPRHPERFDLVRQLAEKAQLKTCMRSTKQPCTLEADVYIADTMGELKFLYGAADICFVGGSMIPVGGHNILEPAAMGTPVMFGPYMVNFKEIAKNVLDLKAAIQCENKKEIIETVINLYTNDKFRNEMVSRAKQFVSNNQGATELTAKIISNYI
ncbi:MAG: lipid IV(A) 3-deoxy-D-manno-octulosonic acid transferase [Methylococcales bacterium]